MGRVTFEGPVKANGGFEIGQAGSRSSVAGTVIFTGTNSGITLYTPIANLTTVSISGTMTVASISLAPSSTANQILVGSAVTGWNNVATTVTPIPGAAVTLNATANSKFYLATTSTGAYTITPVGGYYGQDLHLYWSVGTTTALVFASTSSIQIRMADGAAVTGWAGATGSLCSLHLTNLGPGTWVTPTTSSLWIEVSRANNNATIL